VSVAAIIAAAANTDGRRAIVGLHIGPSEAETFWATFLKDPVRRGLAGVKPVISDAHQGLRAAAKVLGATWQRCRIHVLGNALAHAGRRGRGVVSALPKTVFVQENQDAAREQWREVADQLRDRFWRLSKVIDGAEDDVLACMAFHPDHRARIASTTPRSASSPRSSGGPTSSRSSPTTAPSSARPERSSSNRTTRGPSAAAP
jgi:transposase-like protein